MLFGAPYAPQASDTNENVDCSVASLRLRYPNASEEELAGRAGALRLGPELTRRAFGDAAEAWLE